MNYPHITLQKTFCLFFVIVGHALLPFTGHNPFWKLYAATPAFGGDFIAGILLAVLVPSFIFASGFLLEKTLQERNPAFSDILESRIKRLLAPWFWCMLFWLVPLYTLFDIPAYNRPAGSTLFETYLAGLEGRFTDHLWFLLVLFWASLFWLIFRPLLLKVPALPARGFRRQEWLRRDKLEAVLAKLDTMRPRYVNPAWFTLRWRSPAISSFDLAGLGLALAAALAIQLCGQQLTWFCFRQTAGPILFLYCGMLAFRHRDWLDAFLLDNAPKVFPVVAVVFSLLLPAAHLHFLVAWALGILGALLTYHLCLLLTRIGFPAKKATGPFAYFSKNAFRFYLFHMPTALVCFTVLNNLDFLSPWCVIIVNTIVTLCITAAVVRCSHTLERTQLPKIAAGMRPHD